MRYLKLFAIFTMLLMTIPLINHVNNNDPTATATPDQCVVGLDTEFLEYVAQELSQIIFTAYNQSDPYELKKGRSFGSKGEHAAKDLILYWFKENCSIPADYVSDEEITDITDEHVQYYTRLRRNIIKTLLFDSGKLNNLLNMTYHNLTIHDQDDPSNNTSVTDFYISPLW